MHIGRGVGVECAGPAGNGRKSSGRGREPIRCAMDVDAPRRRTRIRWPFLVALGVAVCALAVRYTLLARGATRPTVPTVPLVQTLVGVTRQGTTFDLDVQNGRVQRLSTNMSARCAAGHSWRETWSPAEGNPVHFTETGRTFVTEQHVDTTYPGGVAGAIGFAIRGTLTADGGAQGTIRLVARFYRAGYQWNACDSLDVAWAVGPGARARLRTVRLGKQVSAYFAAVPSLASHVSSARQRFISRVDGTCVSTFRSVVQAEEAVVKRDSHVRDSGLLDDEYYVLLHAWQYETTVRLGQPPQARALYDAWLTNFRQRVLDEHQGVVLEAQGRVAAGKRVAASVTALKARGDVLGQKFGLVRCTSNVGTAVPILDDGQPLPLP